MTTSLSLETGASVSDYLAEVAVLQSRIFQDYPHLCDWDATYYERLLHLYTLSCDDMILVLIRDDGRLVGASTGRSLENHLGRPDETVELFRERGYGPSTIFYCADSVLLPSYRGRGFGVEFFRQRELHARSHGYTSCTFCAVQRAVEHEKKPMEFKPLDAFWARRGYAALPGLQLDFQWRDIGEAQASQKRMQFYFKGLADPVGAPGS